MKTKAAVLYEMGLAQPYAESSPFVVEEITLAAPGPGEVLVEIAAAGLCHSDLSVVDGSRPRVMPMVLGHEASGIVREVGPTGLSSSGSQERAEFSPGDHVVFSWVPICGRCHYCTTGRGALCQPGGEANIAGTLLNGARRFTDTRSEPPQICHHHLGVSGFSQFTVAAQESLVKIDDALPLNVAALFGCAVMTGVGAVLNTARVEAGSSVAIFGMGGVGLSAVMGARAAGTYPIIAVDRVPDKLALAREFGATHTINAADDDPVAAIKEIGGGGADYAFESVGNANVLIQAYDSTGRGGTTVTVGLPAPDKMFTVPALGIVAEERTIKGSYMGSCIPRRDIPRYIAMYQAGILPVDKLHTHTLKLEEINEGFDRLAQAQAVRQIISFA
ncbi:MAG TPA: zinc-dependent alcohol dehydrogenase family protein [Pyrinomonadaceae bacterium]|nr:zinc-dependent alcohol dehydrogenase family protein [Pyrinomonadaceae bacterium]